MVSFPSIFPLSFYVRTMPSKTSSTGYFSLIVLCSTIRNALLSGDDGQLVLQSECLILKFLEQAPPQTRFQDSRQREHHSILQKGRALESKIKKKLCLFSFGNTGTAAVSQSFWPGRTGTAFCTQCPLKRR